MNLDNIIVTLQEEKEFRIEFRYSSELPIVLGGTMHSLGNIGDSLTVIANHFRRIATQLDEAEAEERRMEITKALEIIRKSEEYWEFKAEAPWGDHVPLSTLDGNFSAEDLEAIACLMRNGISTIETYKKQNVK